jgi:uncharacterized protein (TIGR04255 family)
MSVDNLKNPPITEAIIVIQASLAEDVALECFDISDDISSEFLEKKLIVQHSGEMTFDSETHRAETAKSSSETVGFRYTRKDGLFVVQSTRKGLTVSRLKPYSSWDELEVAAKELWKIYMGKCSPISTSGISVRYINSLAIPLPFGDLSDWFQNPPSIPAVAEFGINGFFHRTYCVNGNDQMTLTLASEPGVHKKVLPIILDIDIRTPFIVEANDESIWEELGRIRMIENEAFYKSLTDKAMELYR